MKKLTDTQKKWALTACLGTVLSFNLLLSLPGSQYSVADLAQNATPADMADAIHNARAEGEAAVAAPKAAPAKAAAKKPAAKKAAAKKAADAAPAPVADGDAPKAEAPAAAQPPEKVDSQGIRHETADVKVVNDFDADDGLHKVMFVKEGDKTVAIVSGKDTQGNFCMTCGSTRTLPVEFTKDLGELKVALRKALKDAAPVAAKVDDKDKKKSDDDDKDSKEDSKYSKDADIEKIQKRCEDKEDDSRLNCFATRFSTMLSDKKSNHSKSEVIDLYKNEIAAPLLAVLSDIRDGSRREFAEEIINDLLKKIDKKYNYIRESLLKLSAKAVATAEGSAQKEYQMAQRMAGTNPSYAQSLLMRARNTQGAAETLAMNLDQTIGNGLDGAIFSKALNESQALSMYTTDFQSVVNSVTQGMRVNPATFSIPGVDIINGSYTNTTDIFANNRLNFNTSAGAVTQLQNNGQGISVVVRPNNVNPSMTTANAPFINGTQNGANGGRIVQVQLNGQPMQQQQQQQPQMQRQNFPSRTGGQPIPAPAMGQQF